MIDPNLTDEQRQAVTDGGGSLLIRDMPSPGLIILRYPTAIPLPAH